MAVVTELQLNTTAQPAGALPRAISREEMAALPIRRYEGEVVVVASGTQLQRALDDLRGESAVGFDTETRPAFRVGESYLPCLVQAATARAVYLFQIAQTDFSAQIAELMENAQVTKVGVSIADDLRNLTLVFPFAARSVLDIGRVAHRHGLKQTGVRNLAGMFLGFRIPKGSRTSNWAAPRLSAQQVSYAATDAWACRELYLRFRELGLV